ncbi:RhoGEF domain-containing protein [Phanerochaete sordida]|uniref:RhoGEF domain-containing protein n=1 Tax=Phanerochaete sordida TaxID=48140 RepID=A0A9P3FXU9_9APHY|nr:RhoGEF domain-containing protein [Phanerochaete sordida]
MALSHSPRKATVPLASGDERSASHLKAAHLPKLTRRVFYCGVVVENTEHDEELPHDVQDLIASLGEPIDLELEPTDPGSSNSSTTDLTQSSNEPHQRKRATTLTSINDSLPNSNVPPRKRANTVTSSALTDIINELVATERSYVERLRTLKSEYADPLRHFSKSKETAILPPYEAKIIFGNLDQLIPVNEAFLRDLERMLAADGPEAVGGVGDVCLKHFKDLKGFEVYRQYYAKREEAQHIFEQEVKHSSFSSYIDRIKYAQADVRNRVGLRELLMDPVQRIPRYTLMFRTMIKHMPLHDPQRAKLVEADEIASKIALAETDEQTKRAAIMYCISSSVDDFPPNLISHSRKFVDCIDVEDVFAPAPDYLSTVGTPSSSSSKETSLHCTLFLFDDKLVIAKRPGDKNGKALTGLDDLDKVVKGKGLATNSRRGGLSCKGVMEVVDVVATDVGGADFHLYLETPPQDQTGDKWNGRAFRAMSVVFPPSPVNLDPTRTEAEKQRFLENLWMVQARYRTRFGQSVILKDAEREVENRAGRVTTATTYFNLFQRTAYLREKAKMKAVVHVDTSGFADPIPFGDPGAPFVIMRLHPLAGEVSRWSVQCSDPDDQGEEDIVENAKVHQRIIATIHHYGLFKFRTNNISAPPTPTVTRTRAAIFGLDAISRNLFHGKTGSPKDHPSIGHKRAKTFSTSRASIYSQSTATGESSLSHSSRSRRSTVTAATSLEEDRHSMLSADTGSASSRRSQSLHKAKKLLKKRRPSSGGSGSELEASPRRDDDLARSRSPSSDWYTDNEDQEDEPHVRPQDQSDHDLAARLELARHNSRSQTDAQFSDELFEAEQIEEDLYEDDPNPFRPLSRASRASTLPEIPPDSRPSSSMSRPVSPSPAGPGGEDARSRMMSLSVEHRPRGPRSPSPRPAPGTPEIVIHDLPSETEEDATISEDAIVREIAEMTVTPRGKGKAVAHLPRSRRQPFDTGGGRNTSSGSDTTQRNSIAPSGVPVYTANTEPLSIRRKVSSGVLNPHRRRVYTAGRGSSPMAKPGSRVASLTRRTSSQLKQQHMRAHTSMQADDVHMLVRQSESVKDVIEDARRSVRHLRQQYEQLAAANAASRTGTPLPASRSTTPLLDDRPLSPVKQFRATSRATPPPMTKEAQARMEEMQRLIGRRAQENPGARPRPLSMVTDPVLPRAAELVRAEEVAKSMDELAAHVDSDLSNALQHLEHVTAEIPRLTSTLAEKSDELEKTRNDLANLKLQVAFLKQMFDDCTAEKDALYDAFNEELDGMFNDASLPEDEAWAAMSRDMVEAKKSRNEAERQNLQLRHQLAEAEAQRESYAALLRAHGLIP